MLLSYLHYYDLDDDIGALFIFCNNPDAYLNLKHKKLIGIFNDPKSLVEAIRVRMFVLSAEKSKTSIHLLDQEQTWSRIVPALTLTQIWYQLALEVPKDLPRDEQGKQEMIKKSQDYYIGQSAELLQIEQFRTTYTSEMAIEWYTADSFVHRLVNKALRSENIDLLYAFRFFYGDLSTGIKQEHVKQEKIAGTVASKMTSNSNAIIKLFSGQQLPRAELDRLEKSIGTVVAINSFFSTSIRRSEAQDFANQGVLPANIQRVFIEILLNTSLPNISTFAGVDHRTRFHSEHEVVFDCSALFNITYVKYDLFSEIWSIKMIAVPKSSIREHPYVTIARENFIRNHSAIVAFGNIMAHGFDREEDVIRHFSQLLSTYSSDHIDIPDILQQRGVLHEKKGEHALALSDYNRALEIRRERVQENLLGMASLFSNIGILRVTTSDFQASRKSHQEALSIYEHLYKMEEDHVTKAKVHENIGLSYHRDGMPSKALEHFTSAQNAYRRILPAEHLFAIQLLGHIGTVHETTNNFTVAIELFRRQFDQSKEILPVDHPLLITYLDSFLRVCMKNNQTSNVNAIFSEHLRKLNQTLGDHHPLVPSLIIMVAALYDASEPLEAIRLYEQALQIGQNSKRSDRSSMLISHQNLARLYTKFGKLSDALAHAESALTYHQQYSFEKGNRSLEAAELHNIGLIYLEMGSFTNALQYLTKSLTIYRAAYASDHPSVQAILMAITQAANQSRSI